MMDKSAADAYVYAKVSGILANSYSGKNADKLYSAKSLTELYSLLFKTEVPSIPEKMHGPEEPDFPVSLSSRHRSFFPDSSQPSPAYVLSSLPLSLADHRQQTSTCLSLQ